MLEPSNLSVECGDNFLRVHVSNYSKPAVSREHLPCFESSLAVFATALLYGIDGYGCSVQNGTAGVSFLLALKKRWS